MSVNLSRFQVVLSADGVGSVQVLLDSTPVQVTSGYGGWTVVSRQRKVGLSVWQGKDPLRLSVPILFDGFADGISQEIPISRLSRMALPPLSGGEPPTVTIKGLAVPVPGPATWVIESLAWGTNVIWDTVGGGSTVRLRQDCVIGLLQYVAGDRVAFKGLQPASSPTGSTKSGWPKSYVAVQGDTLNKIAKKFYGDSTLWKKIGDANSIRDPGSVKRGQKIRVPAP